jgi:hypothetical protein
MTYPHKRLGCDLTVIGASPCSPETLQEIARVVPADFQGTVFIVSDTRQGRSSSNKVPGRRRDSSRPDAAADVGLRLRPMGNKGSRRKRA